jgi:hypothetical protein
MNRESFIGFEARYVNRNSWIVSRENLLRICSPEEDVCDTRHPIDEERNELRGCQPNSNRRDIVDRHRILRKDQSTS